MKRAKKLFGLLLAFCMVLSLLSVGVLAAGTETSGMLGESLSWTLSEDGTLTISGTGEMNNYGLMNDNLSPFSDDSRIKAVVIEPGVTSVGDFVFAYCPELAQVTIPDAVTRIGHGAFQQCESLTGITLPGSVQEIGEGAFMSCRNLKRIEIPSGVTIVSGLAFCRCESLEEVILPSSVRTIDASAFQSCTSLERIEIPDGVTYLDSYAFGLCEKLREIELPVSLTEVAEDAFVLCASIIEDGDDVFMSRTLTDVYYPGTQEQWDAIAIHNQNGNVDGNLHDAYGNNPLLNATIHFQSRLPVRFKDVPGGMFYTDAVAWAVEHGITQGTGEGTFSPDATCTRGQIVTLLWRAAGQPLPENPTGPFSDVSPDDYYYNAVLWAVESGITSGTGNGMFSPDGECTRSQVVTFLYRFAGSPAVESAENPFADVPSDAYYCSAVLWAVENGITQGTGEGRFSPDMACTRGQIVTFLFRDLA